MSTPFPIAIVVVVTVLVVVATDQIAIVVYFIFEMLVFFSGFVGQTQSGAYTCLDIYVYI